MHSHIESRRWFRAALGRPTEPLAVVLTMLTRSIPADDRIRVGPTVTDVRLDLVATTPSPQAP